MGTGLQEFAVIGFGEAGSILGEDLVAAGREVAMYDFRLWVGRESCLTT
jgi:3-hydroxyisobutyrate dehydrogenase-like beta-hydroxyacid dehydrogenase